MTIPEKINFYLGKEYAMKYNLIHGVLTITQEIGVWEFLEIKEIIYKKHLFVTNIIVET